MVNRPATIRRQVQRGFLQQAMAARRARLLFSYGVLLISAAGSVIIHTAARANDPFIVDGPGDTLIAFIIFLLGVTMVMLALVADQFPGAARVSVAIADALHRYMFGGGN